MLLNIFGFITREFAGQTTAVDTGVEATAAGTGVAALVVMPSRMWAANGMEVINLDSYSI